MTRTPRDTDHGKRPAGTPLSRVTSGFSRIRGTLRGKTLVYAGAGLAIAGAGVATVSAGVFGASPAGADAISGGRIVTPVAVRQHQSMANRQHGHPVSRARPAGTQMELRAHPAAPAGQRKPVTRKPVTRKPVTRKPVTRKALTPKAPVDRQHRARIRPACHGIGVSLWTCEAFRVLAAHGVPGHLLDPGAVAIIAQGESGGNPAAVNNWDSNAAAGTPSTGLMQTIAPTFQQYCLPGHCGSMLNPVDDIIAATRYADGRYGGVASVPGVQAVRAGGSYVGY